MKAVFSSAWQSSSKPRKQRKYVHNAPLHIKAKLMASHLSKELKKRYGTRSMRVRSGDKVKIMRGNSRGKEGKVERVLLRYGVVHITGFDRVKADGSKMMLGFQPSNLQILQIGSTDKMRKAPQKKEVA